MLILHKQLLPTEDILQHQGFFSASVYRLDKKSIVHRATFHALFLCPAPVCMCLMCQMLFLDFAQERSSVLILSSLWKAVIFAAFWSTQSARNQTIF